MIAPLVAIIGLLLLYIAYIEWRHEQWAQTLVERLTPPPAPLPALRMASQGRPPQPRTLTREELLGALEPRHMPFLLERLAGPELWEVAPTREWRKFESYGVDISVAPTICVD